MRQRQIVLRYIEAVEWLGERGDPIITLALRLPDDCQPEPWTILLRQMVVQGRELGVALTRSGFRHAGHDVFITSQPPQHDPHTGEAADFGG